MSLSQQDESAEHWSPAHIVSLIRPWFDPVLYASEYRDLTGDAETLLRHYCERGWREGRNPNLNFDTLGYLRANPDVAAIGANPFYHYLLTGQAEDRPTQPAVLPSQAANTVLGRDPGDWVALLTPHVDTVFYAAALGATAEGVDLVAHFAYSGWLDGLDPSPDFHTRDALTANPDLLRKQLNPLVHALATAQPAAAAEPAPLAIEAPRFGAGEFTADPEWLAAVHAALAAQQLAVAVEPANYTDPIETIVARELDVRLYRALYPDVVASGVDPVHHYTHHGWREDRVPTAWFDGSYYRAMNADVREANANPFWHFLAAGRAEGRLPRRELDYRIDVVSHAHTPQPSLPDPSLPDGVAPMPAAALAAALQGSAGKSGLVLAIADHRSVNPIDGLDLFIADEQAAFAARGLAYLVAVPAQPSPLLAPPGHAGYLSLTLDGTALGQTDYPALQAALAETAGRKLLIVHGLLGHDIGQVIALQRHWDSTQNLFWLHDYAALCPGYRLLRNDLAFCGAPPPDSAACQVCVYGPVRPDHLAAVATLFAAVEFEVVAPSQAALAVWRGGSGLPEVRAHLHGHYQLQPAGSAADPAPGRPGTPVRVAFVGPTTTSKGWPIWNELMRRTLADGAYDFVHIARPNELLVIHGLEGVAAAASQNERDAISRAVADHRIDLVLVLSPWPEPFSRTTFEALAGGADIVCLRDSGDVADTVRRRRRGVVVADDETLYDFFTSLSATDYVRRCRETPAAPLHLSFDGTSATLAEVVG